MATVFDIKPSELIEKASQELKKLSTMQMPAWAAIVKTGVAQETQPDNLDWWYVRSASILRKVYVKGPIGVSRLRTIYGKKKNRGVKPEEFRKSGGKIVRVILQQLEKEGFIKQAQKGIHKGRIVTPKGKSFLDKLIVKHGGHKTAKGPEGTTAPEGTA